MSNSNDMTRDEGGGGGFLNHLPAILWQRRWAVIPPLVLLSAAGFAAAALLPVSYESTATLLVEAQELPTDLVASPTTSLLDQRIAKIRQQVLSRGDLIGLIEQNGLYEEERRSKPLSQIVESMREATTVSAVAGDIGQAQANTGATNTIAFSMSFTYRDPYKAQAIMQNFVERFLEIDTANSADQATDTLSFLEEQEGQLRRQILAIEGQNTALKSRNGAALAGAGMVSNTSSGSYDAQIAALQSENRQLVFSQNRRRTPAQVKDPAVSLAEAQLAAVRATYTDGHPDVRFAEQRLAIVRQAAAGNTVVPVEDDSLIRSQIAANNSTIAALQQARADDVTRTSTSVAMQSRTPVLLEQISQLDARANSLREQYQQTSAKLLNARNAARMNQERKGERLSVIDPPSVPDKPTSPEPWLLVIAGIVLGGGLGVLLALALELVLRPIRSTEQIDALGLETLAVVPTFALDKPRLRDRFRLGGVPSRGRAVASA